MVQNIAKAIISMCFFLFVFWLKHVLILLLLWLFIFFLCANEMFQVSMEEKKALSDKLINSSYSVSGCKVEDQEFYKVSPACFLKCSPPQIFFRVQHYTRHGNAFGAYLASVVWHVVDAGINLIWEPLCILLVCAKVTTQAGQLCSPPWQPLFISGGMETLLLLQK